MRSDQRGVTLVVSLIMLMVLTLIVVAAIRFGNINLRIAGNMQFETEATAAAQVRLEKTLESIAGADKPDEIAAQANVVTPTGARDYKVNVTKPVCLLTKNVKDTELDPVARPTDTRCYGGTGGDPVLDASGNPIPKPTTCKDQQWEVQASVDDAWAGTKVTVAQGVSIRVGTEVQCP
jgi:hypothetical protein